MYNMIVDLLSSAVNSFDEVLQETPAHQVVLATAAVYFLYNQYNNPWIGRTYRSRHNKTVKQHIIDTGYELTKNLPVVRSYITEKINNHTQSTRAKIAAQRAGMILQDKIPDNGLTAIEILHNIGINNKHCTFDFQAIEGQDEAHQLIVQEGDGKIQARFMPFIPKNLPSFLKRYTTKQP